MTLSISILIIAGLLYFAAFLLHLTAFLGLSERSNQWALLLMRIGFLIHTFFFFTDPFIVGAYGRTPLPSVPVSSFGQVMAFFSWALAFVYLVLLARVQSESFGLILAPLLSLFMGIGLFRFHSGQTSLPTPFNPYFILHLGTAFFAYASFTLSFTASVLYLLQHHELKRKRGGTFYHKLPSLEALEGLIHQPMAWGVFLLTLAIGIGFLWSKSAFGTYQLWEPKIVSTIAIACFYLVLVYFHYGAASRGKRLVVMSLVAFMFVFLNFFGMNLIGKGLHQLFRG